MVTNDSTLVPELEHPCVFLRELQQQKGIMAEGRNDLTCR